MNWEEIDIANGSYWIILIIVLAVAVAGLAGYWLGRREEHKALTGVVPPPEYPLGG